MRCLNCQTPVENTQMGLDICPHCHIPVDDMVRIEAMSTPYHNVEVAEMDADGYPLYPELHHLK